MDKAVIGTKIYSVEEVLEEYGRVCEENEERRKRIFELEAELAKKETLLKMREEFCEECKEKSAIEKLKSTPLIEESRSRDLNFNLVSKMLDVIEMILTDTQS